MVPGRKRAKGSFCAAVLTLAALAGGCAGSSSQVVRAYYAGDTRTALEMQSRRIARTGERHRNRALEELRLASVAIAAGETATAESALLAAASRIEDTRRRYGREQLHLYSHDMSEPFVGYPYERMMAHFYLGLIRYLRKDYEGALASFRSAAAADQEGVSWQDVSDSPIVHLMAGKCHAHLGDKKEAKAAFDDAEKACGLRRISAEKLERETNLRANVGLLVEMGRGPGRIRWGDYGEVVSVSSLPQDVGECKVAVDGGDWRSVPVLEDLDYQAATHGGRRVEAIIFGRPVAADALAAAGISSMVGAVFVRRWEPSLALALSGVALLGAAAAVEADADVRAWEMLPVRIAYIGFDLPPGRHSIRLEFYGPDGCRKPEYSVALSDVEAPEREETFLWVRALPRVRTDTAVVTP